MQLRTVPSARRATHLARATLVLALAALAVPASAQRGRDAHRFENAEEWSIRVDASAFAEADLDGGGELEVSRVGGEILRTYTGEEGAWFRISYGHLESSYDFGGTTVLPSSSPFDDTKEDAFSLTYGSFAGEQKVFWSASLISGRSKGVSLDDSLYGELVGGLLWETSPSLDLGIGLVGRTQLEDDAEIFPIPLFEWRVTDDVRVGVVRSADPGVGVEWSVHERLDLYANLRFDERQFRIEDQNLLQDAAAVDEEDGLRAGLQWHGEGLDVELFGGVAERRITIDADDEEVADDDVDPAGVLGLRLTWNI